MTDKATAAVVVLGATGRMGRLVVPALRQAGFTSVLGVTRQEIDEVALADGPLHLVRDAVAALRPGGVVVDFALPGHATLLQRAVRERQARLVIGTTGHTPEERKALEALGRDTAVVLASNFSLGINRLAQCLPGLRVLTQEGFEVECLEAHHRQKRDAPSGTAWLLLEALLGRRPARARHGRVGGDLQRPGDEVGIHSLRLGQIVGEHTVILGSDHEVIEIRHRALDRAAFVSGVPPAVRFVQERPAGLFGMMDVIGHENAPSASS